MKKAFCPMCGVPSSEGTCDKCTLQLTKLLNCPDKIKLMVCSLCNAEFIKGRWQINECNAEKLASKRIHDSIEIHKDFRDLNINIHISKRGSTRYLAYVFIEGQFRGFAATDHCNIPITIEVVTCDRCSRIAGRYYEATIQLRGFSETPSENELEECKRIAFDFAEASYRKGDQLSFIQEICNTKGGVDISLGSAKLGRQIAKVIIRRFGGKTVESNKLFGKKDGRDIFRTTILIRLPRLKIGDIVSWKGCTFEAIGFEGRKTQFISIDNGRRLKLNEEDAENAIILGNKAESLKTIIVESDKKVLEIIDPQSYRTIFASKPQGFNGKPGEEVLVLRTAKGLIVLG
ncbi:MAG: hypothetical protein MUO26_07515 [Methanotrichaceae archaeon]|nr:hypothetical protein [Methanotrichaceae archaeon]